MSNKIAIRLGIALFIFIILFATNPSGDSHKTAINNEFKKENTIAGVLGVGRLAGALTTYNDYFLFSTTEIDGSIISFGILTKVFVVRDLKLD